jgi:hypothetical protein
MNILPEDSACMLILLLLFSDAPWSGFSFEDFFIDKVKDCHPHDPPCK